MSVPIRTAAAVPACTPITTFLGGMRMFKKLRVTVSASTAIVALAAMVAVPAGAATSTTDPSLASDTTLAGPATISGAGSTFDAPLITAAQAIYSARNTTDTLSSYQAVGSGPGQT